MPCPDLGALRASLDDAPGGTPAPLHDHVHACASCSDVLAELQRNAELAAPAIAMTEPHEPLPDAAVEAALVRLEQRRALNSLPERQRACLLLRHAGYSYAEIAATLDLAVGSVGVLLARGERAFREAYLDTDDADPGAYDALP